MTHDRNKKKNSILRFSRFFFYRADLPRTHARLRWHRQFWRVRVQMPRGSRLIVDYNLAISTRDAGRCTAAVVHATSKVTRTPHTHTRARTRFHAPAANALFDASTGRRAYVDARYYAHSYTRIPLTAVSHPLGVPRWNVTRTQTHIARTRERIPRACVRACVRACAHSTVGSMEIIRCLFPWLPFQAFLSSASLCVFLSRNSYLFLPSPSLFVSHISVYLPSLFLYLRAARSPPSTCTFIERERQERIPNRRETTRRIAQRGGLDRIIKRNGRAGCGDQFAPFFVIFRRGTANCTSARNTEKWIFRPGASRPVELDCDGLWTRARARRYTTGWKTVALVKPDKGNVVIEMASVIETARCMRIFIIDRRRKHSFEERRAGEWGTRYDPKGNSWNIINKPVTFALVCERPRKMPQSLLSTIKYILKYRLCSEVNLLVTGGGGGQTSY